MSGAGGRGWGVALCLLAASADGRLLSFHRIVYQLSQGMVTKWRPAACLLAAYGCCLRLAASTHVPTPVQAARPARDWRNGGLSHFNG